MGAWVRIRLRAAPGAACALALLVAFTACLAAAFPRVVDRYEDTGLRRAVADAPPHRTTVQFVDPSAAGESPPDEQESSLRPDTLHERYTGILAAVERPLAVDRARSAHGVSTTEALAVPDPWLPRPAGLPARMTLATRSDLAGHSRLREGRLPRTDGTVTAATAAVEAAVTAETAKTLRIEVGSVIHVPRPGDPLPVRVTGIVTPLDPRGAYWSAQPLLRAPSLARLPDAGPDSIYWHGALLLAPEAAPVLLGTEGAPWSYWDLAPDTRALTARDLPALSSSLASLVSGPGLRAVRESIGDSAYASTDLDEVLGSHQLLRSGVAPLVSVAASGAGTVAAVVLLMAGGLAADRRRAELALLRARGCSLPGLTGRLLAETAVVAVPAGAAGLVAALLAVPSGRRAYAVAAAAGVTLVACLSLPLRAAARHAVVRFHGGREDVTSVRPSRRRTVAELTVLALALGAVVTLRMRGTDSADQLVSAAPVLVGVIAALVLARLYPLPLRLLARPVGRLRGAVAHLSLARAGRTSAPAVLPLLALLTALTTVAFGTSVLTGVTGLRDRAAVSATGADARLESSKPLPGGLAEQVRRVSGVREVTAVSRDEAIPDNGGARVPMAGVDPEAYAELARRTGLGAFPAPDLTFPGPAGAALPALASPSVAERLGSRPFTVSLWGEPTPVRIVLVRETTPAVLGTEFLVVDRAGLTPRQARPTALLVTGDRLDGAALRAPAGPDVSVRLLSETRARYVDSPLQSGAERVYTASVAAGAGYTALALVLTLARAAPERRALLARLRTMGLTRAQGRRLLVLESLPQAVLAALGGILAGWAAVRLLAPGIDLTAVALGDTVSPPPAGPHLGTDAWSLLLPALCVVALTTGVAAAQAWWTGRRGAVRELRVGDAR
ncbi:membrane protein [Streptomyces ruber]|uniref:Membrane protein n=2 Tax=Streptomyces TaxID=1883 RepID=A0A918EQF5_9ACTN|nr:FtsX-like permease family protein [Streptomyces ruber]GGQ55396.1 membrane protein [Streptomyces ruber]